MSFVDMEITRRQFAARYVNVGRAMLGRLADIYGLDIDVAVNWADAIDREAGNPIADAAPVTRAGIEGAAHATTAVPSIPSHGAVLSPEASQGGAEPSGEACTAAPGFSHPSSAAFGSHGASGAAAPLSAAAAPEQFPRA